MSMNPSSCCCATRTTTWRSVGQGPAESISTTIHIIIPAALCYEAVRDALALAKCPSAGRVSDGKRLWLQSRDALDSQSESRPHIPSKDNSNLAAPVFQHRAEPCYFLLSYFS